MKIVTAKEMAAIEAKAYESGSSEDAFMQAAGKGCANKAHLFYQKHQLKDPVLLIVGKGNNGGDAYVAGIELLKKGYKVLAWQITPLEQASPLCQKYGKLFVSLGGSLTEIQDKVPPTLPKTALILDGLFGTGFHGSPRVPFGTVIERANNSGVPIIAIDIPSGLNGNTGETEGTTIRATQTITLGLPKWGCFLQEGWNVTGHLHFVDFGLPKKAVAAFFAKGALLTPETLSLPPVMRNRHKYQAGYVVGLSGSKGMSGAPLLSGLAALRGGAGIVRLLHPVDMEVELQASPLELIKSAYPPEDLSLLIPEIQRASACFVGPGIGRAEETFSVLSQFIKETKAPLVMDADALNLLSTNNLKSPKNVLLTPHVGEMKRLLHSSEKGGITREFLKQCQNYAEEKEVVLVLKGGPTFIFAPGAPIYVSTSGDPGMATAGCGDVLTGLLAALLSQGLPPLEAAKLGVCLHGVAGELAAKKNTSYSLIASDLIEFFPDAFKILLKNS